MLNSHLKIQTLPINNTSNGYVAPMPRHQVTHVKAGYKKPGTQHARQRTYGQHHALVTSGYMSE